jgi:hemerythrin
VGHFVEQVKKEGPTEKIIDTVSEAVGSWLLNHIRGDDFRMAAFIKAADVKTSTAQK